MEGEGSGEKRPKKLEPSWKPTRGGKKAKKQQARAEAFVAKQDEAAKASGGDPSGFVVVSAAEEEFPHFRPEDRIAIVVHVLLFLSLRPKLHQRHLPRFLFHRLWFQPPNLRQFL